MGGESLGGGVGLSEKKKGRRELGGLRKGQNSSSAPGAEKKSVIAKERKVLSEDPKRKGKNCLH